MLSKGYHFDGVSICLKSMCSKGYLTEFQEPELIIDGFTAEVSKHGLGRNLSDLQNR